MHFTSLTLTALVATVYAASSGPTLTVYKDAACKQAVQTITFSSADTYQCAEFSNQNAQGVIFGTKGYSNRGFNVWDSDYCDGDQAGSTQVLGQCLSAAYYGLSSFKSAHVSPRNTTAQGGSSGIGLPNPF